MKKEAKKVKLSKKEGHKMELFIKQSEDADPLEDEGEGRTTLREQQVVNCTDTHEERGEEGKITLQAERRC